jgi:hypothetical protein
LELLREHNFGSEVHKECDKEIHNFELELEQLELELLEQQEQLQWWHWYSSQASDSFFLVGASLDLNVDWLSTSLNLNLEGMSPARG